MEIFGNLIGNEDIKSTLGLSIASSEFLHAYIIEGQEGTGRHTLARLASAAIMCSSSGDKLPCGHCESCRKILNDSAPDVRILDAHKVDDVRKIKETLYESTTEFDYKIYILNDCDEMNVKAQNALLISLEEPPKNVVFFLICKDATALLETIRSRAQILRMKPLPSDVIFDYIKRTSDGSLSDEAISEIVVSSNGSLGYALNMTDTQKAQTLTKERERARTFVESLLSCDIDTYSMLGSMFNMQREKLKSLIALSLSCTRDLIIVKKSKEAHLCFYTSHRDAYSVASKYDIKKILSLYEGLERALEDLGSNASVQSTLASILKKGVYYG